VICLAHVINQMGTIEGDVGKGGVNGTDDALSVVLRIVRQRRNACDDGSTARHRLQADRQVIALRCHNATI
jgi:hypothetical protein